MKQTEQAKQKTTLLAAGKICSFQQNNKPGHLGWLKPTVKLHP